MSYSGTTDVFPHGVATVNVSTIGTEGGDYPQDVYFIEFFRAEATGFNANLYKFNHFLIVAEYWYSNADSRLASWESKSNPLPGEGKVDYYLCDETWWLDTATPSWKRTIKKITAYFAKKITVSVSHIGSGETWGLYRSDESEEYEFEESVTDFNDGRFRLWAEPSKHWLFVEWRESGVAVSTDLSYEYRPDITSLASLQDKHFVAVFEPIPGDIIVSAVAETSQGGEVKINDSEWNGVVDVHVTAGDGCVLEARPLDGFMLQYWFIYYYDLGIFETVRTKRFVLSNIQSQLNCLAHFRRCTHLLVNSSTVGSPVRLVYDDRPGGTGKLVADY